MTDHARGSCVTILLAMKKHKKLTGRLALHFETLKRLQLEDVQGGASVITKPCASCFVVCTASCGCQTQVDCTAPTAAC